MPQENYMYLSARRSYLSEFSETGKDFQGTLRRWALALSLALHDIAARYRGSVLGPWWITLTMGSLVLGIGIEYAALFHMPVRELLPFVAVGIVVWNYISTSITEGGEAFIAGAAMLRQTPLPLPLFLLRCMIRNIINLGHHIVIIVAVFAYFGMAPRVEMLMSVPGFLLTSFNLGWLMILVAFLSARFRDVPQIIGAVLQLMFFLTPIFWRPPPAIADDWFIRMNPLHYAVEAIRAPLLGVAAPHGSLTVLALIGLVGWTVTILIYNQIRRRVVHYL